MSNDTMTPEPLAPTAEATLPELTAQFAQLLAFEALTSDYVKTQRKTLTDRMLAAHEATGGKSFEAKTPAGNVMAQFSLRGSEAAFKVTDPTAFLNWVLENFPTEIDMDPVVKPAFQKKLLSAKRLEDTEEGVVDTETGSVVEGVSWVPAGKMNSFGTSWKGEAGREQAVSLLVGRTVNELLAIPAGGDE